MNSKIKSQLDFAEEIDKAKNIKRRNLISDASRRENDAEHSWHMAIMAYLFKEYSNEKIDLAKTMLMCLIHDIVEIDAGDTYAYDENAHLTKREREEAAKKRIYSILPKEQGEELTNLFDEFEANETPEAKFAHALDNIQPIMLHNANGGIVWKENGVTSEQIYKRQIKTKIGSEALYEVADEIIKEHIKRGNIKE